MDDGLRSAKTQLKQRAARHFGEKVQMAIKKLEESALSDKICKGLTAVMEVLCHDRHSVKGVLAKQQHAVQ
jgi:hypothetical protein